MTMQLVSAMPNRGTFLERNADIDPFDIGMYAGLPPLIDGAITIDDSPGWGVTIRDDWLADCTRTLSGA